MHTGVYPAITAVGVFLVVLVVGWVLYITVWAKGLSKLLSKKDKYVDEELKDSQNYYL